MLALDDFLNKVVTRIPGLAVSVRFKTSTWNSVQHKRKPSLFSSFARHHTIKHLHKCAQLLRFLRNVSKIYDVRQ